MSRIVRRLAAALAFAVVAIPALASAEEGRDKKKTAFPVAGAVFVEKVNERIVDIEERIEKALDKRQVTPEKKREVLAIVEAGTTKVRTAAQRAAADGTVTQKEAAEVRAVAKEARAAAKASLGDLIKNKGKRANKSKSKLERPNERPAKAKLPPRDGDKRGPEPRPRAR